MNTGSQRKFLSCYTLWLLPAIAGVVLVIAGLVMMTIFVLDSYLTLWRALRILGSLAAGCSLIALSVMRLHKHRRATYAPDQADQLSLNQKRWLWFAPLVLSIMATGLLLSIYWSILLVRKDLLWAPFCCIYILGCTYFSFFFMHHRNEYPSPNPWKRFKCYSVLFGILLGVAVAFSRII